MTNLTAACASQQLDQGGHGGHGGHHHGPELGGQAVFQFADIRFQRQFERLQIRLGRQFRLDMRRAEGFGDSRRRCNSGDSLLNSGSLPVTIK
jgi:hypothetical protein